MVLGGMAAAGLTVGLVVTVEVVPELAVEVVVGSCLVVWLPADKS